MMDSREREGTGKMNASTRCLSTNVTVAGLVFLLCATGLTACARGAAGTPTPVVAAAEKAEIGKAVRSGDWEVTLAGPAEKIKVVGEGDITYQAQGTYVVVPIRVTNKGTEMQLIPRTLLRLKDGQDREFEPTTSSIQVAYVLPRGIEPLLDSPMAADASRESIIMFDVPTDASGLKLTVAGVEETLGLGF